MAKGEYLVEVEQKRGEGKLDDALICCMRGLSDDPANAQGRLLLARIFFQMGFLPFAERELRELAAQHQGNPGLRGLLERFGIGAVAAAASQEASGESVSESDFDIDALELTEEE